MGLRALTCARRQVMPGEPYPHLYLVERLRENPPALLRFARLAPVHVALEIAHQVLRDGRWREAPRDAANLVAHLHSTAPAEWPALADAVLETTTPWTGGEAEQKLLDTLVHVGSGLQSRIAETVIAGGGPGDARFAITLLLRAFRPREQARAAAWATPLARWLVQVGGAELRRTDSALGLLVTLDLVRDGDVETLCAALRILEVSESPGALASVYHPTQNILYPAVERALAAGLPSDWVADVLGGSPNWTRVWGFDSFFEPLDPGMGFPLMREAMLEALTFGTWRDGLGIEAWKRAYAHEPPDKMSFTDAGLESAMKAIVWARIEPNIGDAPLARWGAAITMAWFDRFGLTQPEAGQLGYAWVPDVLTFEPRLGPGIYAALREALAHAVDQDVALARRIVDDPDGDPRLASVAMLTLPKRGSSAATTHGLAVCDVEQLLTRLVRWNWDETLVASVDLARIFSGGRQVVIGSPNDDDVLIEYREDSIVTANEQTYRAMWSKVGSKREALAVSAIYFVHEVLHVVQGVEHKATIAAIRQNGSEHALAHLDLEADDFAARIVAVALEEPLDWLKDLEGTATEAFPATARHTNASVARKSARLLGLRFDLHARRHARFPIAQDELGYASVELPYAAGKLLLMWNGTVTRVLATAPVSAAEAGKLSRAACSDGPLREVDQLVLELLDRAQVIQPVAL